MLKYQVKGAESAREICVFLDAEGSQQLAMLLQDVIQNDVEKAWRLGESEGENWVLYWKQRESECRALLAHPEASEWVGTIALELSVLSALVARLEEGKLNFSVGELKKLSAPSNLEVRFEFANPRESPGLE